jgi:hypothetical protein
MWIGSTARPFLMLVASARLCFLHFAEHFTCASLGARAYLSCIADQFGVLGLLGVFGHRDGFVADCAKSGRGGLSRHRACCREGRPRRSQRNINRLDCGERCLRGSRQLDCTNPAAGLRLDRPAGTNPSIVAGLYRRLLDADADLGCYRAARARPAQDQARSGRPDGTLTRETVTRYGIGSWCSLTAPGRRSPSPMGQRLGRTGRSLTDFTLVRVTGGCLLLVKGEGSPLIFCSAGLVAVHEPSANLASRDCKRRAATGALLAARLIVL